MHSLTLLVPVYRSEASLQKLVERLQLVMAPWAGRYELLLVNDCSPDRSWAIIEDLTARYPFVRGINLMRNFGQHNALLCGIRAARHEIIVTLDDDLQHPPEEIPRLLAKLDEGYDVVYGYPAEEHHGLLRDLASHVTKLALQHAMGATTARRLSAFRAFRTHLRDAFAAYRGPFVSIDVLLTWGTARFEAIPVRHEPRAVGTSGYTVRKLLTHCFNMMTGFSSFPLQLASLMGFACLLFGMAILAVVVVARLYYGGERAPGFAFLASIIVIFSGAQLFALGIIGEYLARMHFRMMDRPPYIVRSTTSEPPPGTGSPAA